MSYDRTRIDRCFWPKVEKTDTCWLWVGTIGRDGYGRYAGHEAYHIAWEVMCGPVPDGLTLDHLCRNRRCVNPAHLEAVTMRENILRGVGPTAVNAGKTHCAHGHPFDEANTYLYDRAGHPMRLCRACNRSNVGAYRARKAAPQ